LLQETRRNWRGAALHVGETDILVIEPGTSPVVIEAGIFPPGPGEEKTKERLGEHIEEVGRKLLSSVAVRLPERLQTFQGETLRQELATALDLEMALYTGTEAGESVRWPVSGWLSGSVSDLSILVQSVSTSPAVVEEAAQILMDGIQEAEGILEGLPDSAAEQIALLLRQERGPQTLRMAAIILINAFVFQGRLHGRGKLAGVRGLDELIGERLTQSEVLTEWQKILNVNYWPIFDIARRILEAIPSNPLLIQSLTLTATRLLESGLASSHDLTGAVFQRLIVDRKFLAAFYTTPSAATLLLGLALRPEQMPSGKTWSDREAVTSLQIADFACGTGTLLSTAYRRIGQLHEMAGGDAEEIHADMMEKAIVGCDIFPAAISLAISMLVGTHPASEYRGSSVLTAAYGEQADGGVALGSLDLLVAPQSYLTGMGIATEETEKTGGEAINNIAPHSSFDLVVMNPPFTRSTNHAGKRKGTANPIFASYGVDNAAQNRMGQRLNALYKNTSAHGHAGAASHFLALADKKLRPGGTLALVMPLTILSGSSWEKSRQVLRSGYRDLIVVSIAANGGDEMAFSADTGMAECLIVGQKADEGSQRGTFVILRKRPDSPLAGTKIAEQVMALKKKGRIPTLEAGPIGGSPIHLGADLIGYVIDAPFESGGWNLARIADISLAQTAYQLASKKRVWFPQQAQAGTTLPMTTVQAIGAIGPVHHDIDGVNSDGSIRGPFDLLPLREAAAAFPIAMTTVDQIGRIGPHDLDIIGTKSDGSFQGPFDLLPLREAAAAFPIAMTTVQTIGAIGPVDRDIDGVNSDGSIRGPFDLLPLKPEHEPTYPVLWNHDADRERTMTFRPDQEGIPRRGRTPEEQADVARKVERVWGTASHCHANLDFRYNSQSTGMQFTPRRTIGGRAWPSVQLESPDLEKALVLWANTTFGLLMHWWHASRVHGGRGRLTKTTLATLPVLDVTALSEAQLAAAWAKS